MFETSGQDGSKTGVLFSGEFGVEAGDVHAEDETQDRFDQRQTHLQQETRNGRTCIRQYLLHIRVEQIYPSRETKSEHAVVDLLCGAQSI